MEEHGSTVQDDYAWDISGWGGVTRGTLVNMTMIRELRVAR